MFPCEQLSEDALTVNFWLVFYLSIADVLVHDPQVDVRKGGEEQVEPDQ
jgi:hypothetical protein